MDLIQHQGKEQTPTDYLGTLDQTQLQMRVFCFAAVRPIGKWMWNREDCADMFTGNDRLLYGRAR